MMLIRQCVNRVMVFLILCSVSLAHGNVNEPGIVYYGMSDASAAVALSDDLFVVADDENNVLRVYQTNTTSVPVYTFDLSPYIVTGKDHPEADIEGATLVGDCIYWITSHGRNKDGKIRPNRYRFIATSVKIENGRVTLDSVGTPCSTLINEMIKAEATQHLKLDSVTRFDVKKLKKKEKKKLAPKKEGLNIEGLCAAPDGNTLYIGFRNPQFFDRVTHKKRAGLVPLLNPQQVIKAGATPAFGSPILLNLDGRGIRSMEYSHSHKAYFIIAGPHDGKADFALYRWSGKTDKRPVLVKKFPTAPDAFTPEALIVFKKSARLFALSDDGSLIVDIPNTSDCIKGEMLKNGQCLNKHLSDQNKKHFRGMWLEVD